MARGLKELIRYRTMQRDRIRTGRWDSHRSGKHNYQARYNYWRDDEVYNREDNYYYPSQRDQYPWRQHDAHQSHQIAPRRSRSPIFTRPSPTYEPADLEPHLPEPRHQQHSLSPRPSLQKLVESPKPDPAYIALTEQPSIPSCDPATSRKLLVLDLNGTLLYRGAHLLRRGQGPASATQRLRTVYPRPYIPAFRAYLFAPETRAWLDTMVWSSAQPHSVEDMVSRTFADYADELLAVWDRKSLGLTQSQYHNKTLSTKDLSKPWKLLPLGHSPARVTSHLARKVTDAAMDTGTPNSIAHSALTTLLLDDSPHKAALQPYNHVCIPEYDSTKRHRDLASLVFELSDRPATKKGKKRDKQKEPQEMTVPPLRPHTSDPSVSEAPGMTLTDTPQSAEEPFEATLLAVIGILDEVKRQTNVAAWIRAGGLWGSKGDAGHSETPMDLSKKEGKRRQRAKEGNHAGDEVFGNQGISVGNGAYTTLEPAVTATVGKVPLSSIWFDDPSTVSYWVARGRKALRELGIEADHGVIR